MLVQNGVNSVASSLGIKPPPFPIELFKQHAKGHCLLCNGTFYATEAHCTHAAADLADGILEDDIVECSLHFGAFHVPSGKAVREPCFTDLKTFRTEVKDGQVYVDLSTPAATAS